MPIDVKANVSYLRKFDVRWEIRGLGDWAIPVRLTPHEQRLNGFGVLTLLERPRKLLKRL